MVIHLWRFSHLLSGYRKPKFHVAKRRIATEIESVRERIEIRRRHEDQERLGEASTDLLGALVLDVEDYVRTGIEDRVNSAPECAVKVSPVLGPLEDFAAGDLCFEGSPVNEVIIHTVDFTTP